MKFILGVLFLPLLGIAQTIYSGRIINSKTKEPIPFATIALLGENAGTNGDVNGHFKLISQLNIKTDSIQVSSIGYQTKVIAKDTAANLIELEEKVTRLNEIKLITKNTWITERLGDFSGEGNIGFSTDGSHTQVAKLFTSPAQNAVLYEVRIRKKNYSFHSHKALFRLRIYDMDTVTKAPSIDLCDQVIEINSSAKVIKVNVEKYKIHLPNRNFFVAVEWLKITDNENRGTANKNGTPVEYVTYRPTLDANRTDNNQGPVPNTSYTIWELNYNNEWLALPWCDNVYISATIKY